MEMDSCWAREPETLTISSVVSVSVSSEVFQNVLRSWFKLNLSKKTVILHAIAAKCVICGMDIHSYIDYTCHNDSSSCMW